MFCWITKAVYNRYNRHFLRSFFCSVMFTPYQKFKNYFGGNL
ncbi:hypothetical protein TPE_0744 [Treponema pedis str. T A4]|uniref:Uncharacterized protein n=1 Tax=Treponema pedis str. T A4 TaxID=1291379 RepID=S5ZSZ8_9SPIR|nr:hypothetical protein TPE_0744 [Treponema pedis str. T A4]